MINITWNDHDLQVDGRITKYYAATTEEPEEGGELEIDAIWVTLKTKKGEQVVVNVYYLLSETDLEEIEELVWENRNE